MRPEAKERRDFWVRKLANFSGSFSDNSARMMRQLREEIEKEGKEALLDHLRRLPVNGFVF
jgi:hypothetical protein